MLHIKCKQCHKEWHLDNAKYCSTCFKELVVEPVFKVGDYIVELDHLITKIEGIDNCGVLKGIINDLSEGASTVSSYPVISNKPRHATQEEIKTYEAALTFHEHGRVPFEIKEGDILRDDKGNIFFVGFPNNFKKEYFTRGIYTFLKTAEEYNEWLGAEMNEEPLGKMNGAPFDN